MAQAAKYLYCIISCGEERIIDIEAIGDASRAVHTVVYRGLATVVSDAAAERYETTRGNMMAHQKVLEKVMQEHTLLPVRFGTVADAASPNEDIQKLLQGRFQEFNRLLKEMENKVELGLKGVWRDEKAIYDEILAENPEIRRLRQRLAGKPPEAVRFGGGIALGRIVKEALERKRREEADRFLAPLRRLAERVRENDTLLDRIIFNAAFLVDRRRRPEYDQAVDRLEGEYGGRVGFKYVGPTPPYNFVDIVVNWEELRALA